MREMRGDEEGDEETRAHVREVKPGFKSCHVMSSQVKWNHTRVSRR